MYIYANFADSALRVDELFVIPYFVSYSRMAVMSDVNES